MTLSHLPWDKNDVTFDWDEFNQEEIWRHGVKDFEFEACFENEHFVIHHPKWKSDPIKYKDRYVVKGVTHGGRKLIIFVDYKGGNLLRPVTAWDDNQGGI